MIIPLPWKKLNGDVMAKSMIRKDLFREIKKTKSRFISIVLLVVLAVSFLYGLRISAPDMHASMDAYLDEQGMFDIQVLSTLGLTEDDVLVIADAEGIAKAEGSYTVDAIASTGDATMVVKGISISDQEINAPYLTEGRMPKTLSECLVEKKFATNTGVKVGDTITLDCGTGSFEDALAVTEFTVVGIAENPLYTSIPRGTSTLGNGSVGAIVMLHPEAYALDYYTEINAIVEDSVALNAYGDEYETLVDASLTAIEAIQPHREKARTDEIIGEARDELDDGWKEYYDGEAEARRELNSAKEELDDAAAEIEKNKKSIQDGLVAVENGYKELDNAAAEMESQRKALAKGWEEYELGLEEYKAGLLQWQQGAAALEAARQQLLDKGMTEAMADAALADSYSKLNASKAELDAVKAELDATPVKLEQGEKELNDAAAQIEGQRTELKELEAELLKGEQELLLGEEEYREGLSLYYSGKAEAEAELAEARADLNEAEEEIADIETAEWYVLDRGSNMGFAGYEQDAERMDRLSDVIPIVFFLVAALVCLTGMTRMVEEQRIQIGSLKAMGYSKWSIAEKYVGYGLLASLIGSFFGLLLGATVLPYIIASCWKVMYSYPGVVLTFEWSGAFLCIGFAVGCCAVAALAAVLTSLRECPAALMRPKAPKPGKRVLLERIPFIWKHLSFTRKVAFRNLFRYKKRFWMTVIGIAGCTGLILTGFGLYNSITDIIDLQFSEVSPYSAVVYTDEDITETETDELYSAIMEEDIVDAFVPCYLNTVTLESDAYTLDGNLLAAEDSSMLDGFWYFRERKTDALLEIGEDSVLLSEKTAELLDLSVGDSITVVSDDRRGEMVVGGIMENYVNHYVFTTKDYCNETLGFYPKSSQILLKYDEDADWQSMGSRLLTLDQVTGIYYQNEAKDVVRNQLKGVYPAVVIIIIAAGALAFVVLFNLSDINLTERRRELATLRVLGFRDKEMRDYVFRENVILTFFGIVLGLVFGVYFHAFVMSTVEVDLVMFGREIHFLSYVFSVLMTLFFAAVVNRIAGRALMKIDMVESMKSVE